MQKVLVSSNAPKGYDPTKHRWQMALDVNKCIGCGLCAEACKKENTVPEAPHYFRTWIERYIIKKPEPGIGQTRGEVIVDSPNGGIGGFPPTPRSQRGDPALVLRAQALQPMRALALCPGLPGRRDL